ncbi:MAG: 4-hydroxythreonine-4-phosphate dehydrogenase PdxA [Phycisphaeraceae bacterium]|nr:4-hydroxythreonine-4-phosphate dehydrogenase PdxA [Phycisphaeraceae bacterium]MCB9846973.1 4-hydroxythreonine-4-phosphate dehydrogenase PdxA [Phycisphaeraceae bacterium]
MKPIPDANPVPTTTPAAIPRVAVTMGDPYGVGPEVVVRALADPALRQSARFVVLGMAEPMQYAADLAEIEPYWWRAPMDSPVASTAMAARGVALFDDDSVRLVGAPGGLEPGPTRDGGGVSFRFVERAIEMAMLPGADPLHVDAVVTGPISKEAWAMAGRQAYPGHTELFAQRTRAKRHAMMFQTPRMRVVLATAHIPLMDIRNALTIGRVFDAIDLASDACRAQGIVNPRVGVCGLNPHAGEAGLLGDEETRLIAPAIELAVAQGIQASGPYPADTIFNRALGGAFDIVVAMYHDQGLIPVKLLDWKDAVNVTIGLPTVRTSPDHGTAYDIAGRNRADASSMGAALRLAVTMAQRRAEAGSASESATAPAAVTS